MSRPPWGEFFMASAEHAALMSTCPRAHVGCVLVRDKRQVSAGFNGSSPGAPHCDEVGCLMVEGHCARTVHAEVNAVANAARLGVSTTGCVAYVTHRPCWDCLQLLANAGVDLVVFAEEYGALYPAPPPVEVRWTPSLAPRPAAPEYCNTCRGECAW